MERNLYHYLYLPRAFDRIVGLLEGDIAAVLRDATQDAATHAEALTTTLHADLGTLEVGREVRIEVGALEPLGARAVRIPVRWTAARRAALFPAMEGQLEAAALSSDPPLTQITFVGRYRPPFGIVGALGDAMAGHQVAEATVHRFLDGIASRISALTEHETAAVV